MQVPTLTSVRLVPATVQTPVVSDTNVTVSDEVATADNATTPAPTTCVPGLLNVIVWLAFATVSVKDSEALGNTPLLTPKVSGNVPPCVGVPDRMPVEVLNVTPVGRVPTSEYVKVAGVPVAVTENEPGALTVKLVALALVMSGAVGVGAGVTATVLDAGPWSTLLLAVTEQVYVVPFVRLPTTMGETVLVPMPAGVQLAEYNVIAVPPVLAGGVKAMVA